MLEIGATKFAVKSRPPAKKCLSAAGKKNVKYEVIVFVNADAASSSDTDESVGLLVHTPAPNATICSLS